MAGAVPLARPGRGPHADAAQLPMRTAIVFPCDIRAASIEIQHAVCGWGEGRGRARSPTSGWWVVDSLDVAEYRKVSNLCKRCSPTKPLLWPLALGGLESAIRLNETHDYSVRP